MVIWLKNYNYRVQNTRVDIKTELKKDKTRNYLGALLFSFLTMAIFAISPIFSFISWLIYIFFVKKIFERNK